MEISRKNISTADIISKEKEILERIQAVKEKYDPVFDELGYELCAEYLCRGEFDDEFYEINYKEENYVDGYVSRANFTVKRKFKDGEPEITVDDDYAENIQTFDKYVEELENRGLKEKPKGLLKIPAHMMAAV